MKMVSTANFFCLPFLSIPLFSQGKISWRVEDDFTSVGICEAMQPLSSLPLCQVAVASDPVLHSVLLPSFPPLSYLLLYFKSLV